MQNKEVQALTILQTCPMANSLSHTKQVYKYHMVFISKYRMKIIYTQLCENIQNIIKDLGIEIIEGHMILSIFRQRCHQKGMYHRLWDKTAMMICNGDANLEQKFPDSSILYKYSWTQYSNNSKIHNSPTKQNII